MTENKIKIDDEWHITSDFGPWYWYVHSKCADSNRSGSVLITRTDSDGSCVNCNTPLPKDVINKVKFIIGF